MDGYCGIRGGCISSESLYHLGTLLFPADCGTLFPTEQKESLEPAAMPWSVENQKNIWTERRWIAHKKKENAQHHNMKIGKIWKTIADHWWRN